MKFYKHLFKFTCALLLYIVLSTSCKKSATVDDLPVVILGDSTNVDTISNHLTFLNAVKKQGAIPTGPAGSSLKISFEDTLYLNDKIKGPIKFLHEDTTQNVAGVYLQVHTAVGGTGGSFASYYYDIPEIPDMADNDTVSVILIGVNPAGLIDPAHGVPQLVFEITIIPYSPGGQPLAKAVRPVKISDPKIDPSGNAGSCGLVLPPGDFWKWDLSMIEDPGNGKLFFYNDPKKVWGAGGQFITGCCINGVSSYNTVLGCDKDPAKAKRKLFPTFFQFQESDSKFFTDGTYSQFSRQIHVNPAPDETDFCGVAPGVVHGSSSNVTESGTWKITNSAYKGDSLNLSTFRTFTSGGNGIETPRGFIHQLNCKVLVLVRPGAEGSPFDMVSFFTRIDTSKDGWYDFI
jgi:hypothetical protein